MKRSFIIICALLLIMEANYFFWRRRRRRRSSPPCSAVNCLVDSWTSWSSCSHQCGTSGTRERTRQQTRVASCGGTCPYELRQTEACNRDSCQNGGTPHSSGCSCRTGYGGGLLRARWVHFTQAYYIFLCETAVLSEGGGGVDEVRSWESEIKAYQIESTSFRIS